MPHTRHFAVLLAATLLGALASAQEPETYQRPVDRRFAYTEESLHGAPTGKFEIEQWFTFLRHTDNDSGFKRIDFKEELEYGLSDRVHLGVDLAEWHWEDSGGERHTRYDASAAEVKFRILDPRTDMVGLGFKTEVGVGPIGLEWENNLMVDKVIDRWELAYNIKVEAGWEGEKLFEFKDTDGEVAQYFAASYAVSPSWFAGAELVHEIPMPDWKTGEDQNLFLGPNVAFHGRDWAMTTTALFLLTGGDDEPAFQLRFIFEIDF